MTSSRDRRSGRAGRPVSRRDFLLGAAALGVGGPSLLAACGGSDKSSDSEAAGTDAPASADTVHIATWPFYIENDQNPQKAPTIAGFEKRTGIKVNYQIAVDDNISFTAKYEGDLKAGKGIGYDVVVPTSWMAQRWIENGWVEQLPADLAARANLIDLLAKPEWDPGRKYSLPYAMGQVGIGYYPDKCGEITSMADFLSPKLKGKTTILSEMRDCGGLFLLKNGIRPEDATIDECLAAIAEVKKYRDQGQFRKITGNGYIEDLGSGDTWAAVAWSGDIAGLTLDNPDIKWVLPKEGAMTFVDTMIVPKGGDIEMAAAWMDYLYDPAVSGPLFEAISYVSPVKGAADFMTAEGKANPMVNPPATADLHEFRTLTAAETDQLEEAFQAATQQ